MKIKLTRKMVLKISPYACDRGLARLPLTLSDDPLENLELADVFARDWSAVSDLEHLADTMGIALIITTHGWMTSVTDHASAVMFSAGICDHWDPYQLAQAMAWIAHELLAKRGL